MQIALYIALGLLVTAAVALQVWLARSSGWAGSRSGVVLALRVFNIVMLIAAIALVVYALARW